jgi:hypothetical protein
VTGPFGCVEKSCSQEGVAANSGAVRLANRSASAGVGLVASVGDLVFSSVYAPPFEPPPAEYGPCRAACDELERNT